MTTLGNLRVTEQKVQETVMRSHLSHQIEKYSAPSHRESLFTARAFRVKETRKKPGDTVSLSWINEVISPFANRHNNIKKPVLKEVLEMADDTKV